MNFELSADQKMIVDSVRTFVRKELPIERMRSLRDDELGFSKACWRQMGELGWLGISYPESVGGFGGNMVDAALIMEQFGTTLVSEPYTASAVVAGHMLLHAGNAAQHQRWLAPMLLGQTVLAPAFAERDGRFDIARVSTKAIAQPGGYRISGEKVWVLAGHAADQYVVSARTEGDVGARQGVSLFVVERGDEGVDVQAVKTMDGRRAAMLKLAAVVPADRLLGEAGAAADTLELAMDWGAAAACNEAHGVMKTALKMTLEYLKTRTQFGVKIGTFQVLQHAAVDMFIETQLAQSVAMMASIKANSTNPFERQRAISAAKVQMIKSGKLVTQQAIQLHGGIGMTDEHDIGLYFKRMQVLCSLWGDEDYHVARFANLPAFAAV